MWDDAITDNNVLITGPSPLPRPHVADLEPLPSALTFVFFISANTPAYGL